MINPESINLRTLNIDSRLRKSGRAEDMEYELEEPVEMPRGACFWVTYVNLPVVWPNVNNNNQLYIKEYNSSGETLKVVQVAKGNYNLAGLASALETALNVDTPKFEEQVSYVVVSGEGEMMIGLAWKGRPVRLDYTGGYQSDLEHYIDLSGQWMLQRPDGTTTNVTFFPVSAEVWSNMQAFQSAHRGQM